jgi:hypothetical protein
MKVSTIITVLNLLLFNVLLAGEDYDAEYLAFQTHETVSKQTGRKFSEFVREVEVYRKIRILTPNGLDRFNRLYIPTYEDLDFRSIVFELNARTIKQNGEQYEANSANIKETTLPGNNPYLRNYEGAVKLVALPQVDVGDIIEYSYKIRYINDFTYHYADSYERIFNADIPIRTYEQSFVIDEKLHSRLLEFNLPSKCTVTEEEEGEKYSWSFIDLDAYAKESFSHDYSYLPHISLLVSTKPLDMNGSWRAVMQKIDHKPKGKFNFLSEFSVNELKKLASEKETVEQKVRLICDSIYQWKRDEDVEDIYNRNSWRSNWYVNNKYLNLFKKLGIKSSLILMRPLEEGDFDEDIITLSQFSKTLIEFENEQGVAHYLTPRMAFTPIDYIPFEFQGSRAVRMRELLSNSTMEVFTVPYQSEKMQVYEDYRKIGISMDQDSTYYDLSIERSVIGDPDFIYLANFNNKVDSSINRQAKIELDELIFNRSSVRVSGSNWNSEVVDYYKGEVKLSNTCSASDKNQSTNNNVPLWKLLDLGIYDNWISHYTKEKTRKRDAHIANAFSATSHLILSPSNGFKPMLNEYLNIEFSNDYGSIECVTISEGSDVKIDITIKLLSGYVPKENWNEFLEFDKVVKNVINLEIPIVAN